MRGHRSKPLRNRCIQRMNGKYGTPSSRKLSSGARSLFSSHRRHNANCEFVEYGCFGLHVLINMRKDVGKGRLGRFVYYERSCSLLFF